MTISKKDEAGLNDAGNRSNQQDDVDATPPLRDTSIVPVAATAKKPPNGGLTAWLRVMGCFFVFFITWGVASTFGAYQAYYQTDLLSDSPPTKIAWIGTTQSTLLNVAGIISGALFDRGYIRPLFITGATLMVLGQFMLSLAKEYYQVMLAQGICIGLGSGILYIPAISLISVTFTAKRPLAIGISSTGSAIGGTVLPIMFRQLQPRIGVAWVDRIFGFIVLGLSILSFVLLQPDPSQVRRRGPLLDPSAFKDAPYVVLVCGLFVGYLGYWVPFFYVTPYAQNSLHTGDQYAFYLLAIMNAGSFFGRALPPFAAMKFGPGVVAAMGTSGLGILILSWIGIHNVPGITVWSILIGFCAGIVVSVPAAIFPQLSPTPDVIGARTGMGWGLAAFGGLIGSPIAGALINKETSNFTNGQIFGGATCVFGGILILYPTVIIARRNRQASKSASQ